MNVDDWRADHQQWAPPIKTGDVVVHDQGKLRGFWRLAGVERLLAGKDGEIRGAVLRVSSENGFHCNVQFSALDINEIDKNTTGDH